MTAAPDLTAFATGLTRGADGCWYSGGDEAVSFPADGYDVNRAIEDTSFWFRHRNACITAVVRRLPPGGPLFDIGGGNGPVAIALEQAGFPTVLVEPGRAGAANALRRRCSMVVCSTIEAAGFRPHSLPAAGMFDVLEHIEDDVGFLRMLHGQMVPGGRLYLTVPAYQFLWSDEDRSGGHFRRYTLTTLRRALAAAGFAVEYQTYFFWLLPPVVFAFRTAPTWLGLGRPAKEDQARRDHAPPAGWKGRLLDRLLNLELGRISRGRTVPFGGSCLVVARTARPA